MKRWILYVRQMGPAWIISAVACCFIVTAIQADIACVDVAGGIIPGIPRGIDSDLMIAAIMGGRHSHNNHRLAHL